MVELDSEAAVLESSPAPYPAAAASTATLAAAATTCYSMEVKPEKPEPAVQSQQGAEVVSGQEAQGTPAGSAGSSISWRRPACPSDL